MTLKIASCYLRNKVVWVLHLSKTLDKNTVLFAYYDIFFLVPSGFLLYSEQHGIHKISVDTYKGFHRLPFHSAERVTYLRTLYNDSSVFWVNKGLNGEETINRAFLNGSGYKSIVKTGLAVVQGLAVDWMAKNVYWTQRMPARIEVARVDGSHRRVLIYNKEMVNPHLIMVNPHIR